MKLISRKQLAESLGISLDSLFYRLKEGMIPEPTHLAKPRGRRFFWSEAEAAAIIQAEKERDHAD